MWCSLKPVRDRENKGQSGSSLGEGPGNLCICRLDRKHQVPKHTLKFQPTPADVYGLQICRYSFIKRAFEQWCIKNIHVCARCIYVHTWCIIYTERDMYTRTHREGYTHVWLDVQKTMKKRDEPTSNTYQTIVCSYGFPRRFTLSWREFQNDLVQVLACSCMCHLFSHMFPECSHFSRNFVYVHCHEDLPGLEMWVCSFHLALSGPSQMWWWGLGMDGRGAHYYALARSIVSWPPYTVD